MDDAFDEGSEIDLFSVAHKLQSELQSTASLLLSLNDDYESSAPSRSMFVTISLKLLIDVLILSIMNKCQFTT